MGYYSRVRGQITFSPAASEVEVYTNKVLRKYIEATDDWPDLRLTGGNDFYEVVECVTTDQFKAYDVEENLEEIVAALPGRVFGGRLEIYGEEEGDIWGLRVKNGKVEQIEPTLVWPED
jgi:hypothetical protein